MDALVHEFPDVFRIKRWTEISKTYEMPKKYIRIGKPRELSPAQRENLEKMRGIKKQVQNWLQNSNIQCRIRMTSKSLCDKIFKDNQKTNLNFMVDVAKK